MKITRKARRKKLEHSRKSLLLKGRSSKYFTSAHNLVKKLINTESMPNVKLNEMEEMLKLGMSNVPSFYSWMSTIGS